MQQTGSGPWTERESVSALIATITAVTSNNSHKQKRANAIMFDKPMANYDYDLRHYKTYYLVNVH